MLNFIDHLPRNSWYAEAVANDPEHARMLLEVQKRQKDAEGQEPYKPPMSTWSPEVAMLADLIDAVNRLSATTVAAAGGKPGEVRPYPRPGTMLEKVRREQRIQKHEALVARVLPHKRKDSDE